MTFLFDTYTILFGISIDNEPFVWRPQIRIKYDGEIPVTNFNSRLKG